MLYRLSDQQSETADYKALGTGLAGPVLAGPLLNSQNRILCLKSGINNIASMIFKTC